MADSRIERVYELITRIQRSVHRSKGFAQTPLWMEETADLTMAQLRALIVITDSGPLSISRLSERLHTGLPSTSAIVDHLVGDGLLQRSQDPADRRRTLVSTTEECERRVAAFRQGPRDVLQAWVSGLTEDELECLVRGMQGLVRVSEELASSRETKNGIGVAPSGHGSA
jgi:DNA-binding MarR family transcriptional regulator